MNKKKILIAYNSKNTRRVRRLAVGKRKSKITNGERIAAISIVAICILLGFVFYSMSQKFYRIAQKHESEITKPQEVTTVVIPSSTTVQAVPKPLMAEKGQIVFMLDDAGNNLAQLQPFLDVEVPITIAVLPSLSGSKEAARRIRAAGKALFLHQPMEAIGDADPGPGAIYIGMSREEVMAVLKRNLAEVGPIDGINNHQGSKITMDKEIMDAVLDFCKENKLIFLDSRTTADTVVPLIARNKGIKILERSIFLDNTPTKELIQKQIDEGVQLLEKKKSVVMIGHIQSAGLADILKNNYKSLQKEGYVFSTTKDIIGK